MNVTDLRDLLIRSIEYFKILVGEALACRAWRFVLPQIGAGAEWLANWIKLSTTSNYELYPTQI